MQSKPKFGVILIVSVTAFLLTACGGGSTGSTWFNMPSVPVRIQEDGTAKVAGFNVGAVLAPEQVEQLQSANVQALEARVGYDGVYLYANGEQLPYLRWDEESVDTVQDILQNLPPEMGVNGDQVARYLPLARQFGLGAMLDLPAPEGQSEVDVDPWRGETPVTEETVDEPTLDLAIGSLTFDQEGNAYIEGVPVSELESALGTSLGLNLDPATLNLLQSINMENLQVTTTPNGVQLLYNGRPLPGIAYDSEALANVTALAAPLMDGEETQEMVGNAVEMLRGANIDLGVSFTGEPSAVETTLPEIEVEVSEDGTLSAMGLPLGANASFPPELLAQLQEANVQHLDVNMSNTGLTLAVNGEVLPTVQWTEESLNTILNDVVQPLADVQPGLLGLVDTLTPILERSPLQADISLPAAAGAEPVEAPAELETTMAAPELGEFTPPTIHLTADFADGQLQSVGGISQDALESLGVAEVTLPPNVQEIFNNLNAETVSLSTTPNQLDVNVNGESLLSISYDEAALSNLLDLAAPFAEGTPLQDEAVMQLLREQILPLAPGADLDVTLNLQ
jgi:hypothetical protein